MDGTSIAKFTPIERKPLAEDKLQAIATRVNRHLDRSVEEVIKAGLELARAKRDVGHGQFERLFRDHPKPVKEPIRITSRWAEKLMRIANHTVLTKSERRSLLPQSVGTLYALAQLPAATVQHALTSGLIYPEMQERDVRLLRDPKAGRPKARRGDMRSDQEIERDIVDTLRGWWQRYPHLHTFIVEEVLALKGDGRPDGNNARLDANDATTDDDRERGMTMISEQR
jgi:hypothetical protein